MKPTELMIGDWVFNKHHKKPIQITPYDFFNHAHLPSGEKYFVGELKVISGRDFEPIPLTAEILERNGFLLKDKKDISDSGYNRWTYTKATSLITVTFCQDLWMIDVRNNGKVKSKPVRLVNYLIDGNRAYLHDLQHALRSGGLNDLADNFKLED